MAIGVQLVAAGVVASLVDQGDELALQGRGPDRGRVAGLTAGVVGRRVGRGQVPTGGGGGGGGAVRPGRTGGQRRDDPERQADQREDGEGEGRPADRAGRPPAEQVPQAGHRYRDLLPVRSSADRT
jgi:hypothetical protein